MSSIRKWRDELGGLPVLRGEMNRLFDEVLSPSLFGQERERSWVPALDVKESDDTVTVTAEVPGMSPEDIDIQLTGNVLTLRGEKKEEKEEKDANWHRIERYQGTFSRQVALPEGLDPEKVKASYRQGVLAVEIAKAEATRPRRIKVKQAN